MMAAPFDVTNAATKKFLESATRLNGFCVEWSGYINRLGYGKLSVKGRGILAHRYSYALFHKTIEDMRLEVDHLCNNRACVNPLHLKLVTRRANVIRSNSPGGRNSRKTHCPAGHELSVNYKNGWRRCLECNRRQEACRRKNKRDLGLCQVCGSAWPGPTKTCAPCLDYWRQYRNDRQLRGNK